MPLTWVGALVAIVLASVVVAGCSVDDGLTGRTSADTTAGGGIVAPEREQAPPATSGGARPSPSTSELPSSPLAGVVVAIDPGHNGGNVAHGREISQLVDAGTHRKECDTTGASTASGYAESEFNWDVSQRMAASLQAAGATVVLTRTDDVGWGPCITERAAIGNEAAADVAISVHADGGPPGGRGFHVLHPAAIPGLTDDIADESERLATAIRDAYAAGTGMPTASYLGSGGLMPRSDLGGLNLSDVPKVFIEAGNMRNAEDAALLTDPAFRQRIAEALAEGIAAYLGS